MKNLGNPYQAMRRMYEIILLLMERIKELKNKPRADGKFYTDYMSQIHLYSLRQDIYDEYTLYAYSLSMFSNRIPCHMKMCMCVQFSLSG